MQNSKFFIVLLGLSIASIATPWPIPGFDLQFFNWFAVCPDGHIAFRGDQHCCDEIEELLTVETTALEITCSEGQMYLEDKEICVDFKTTEEKMPDEKNVCGDDNNSEHEKRNTESEDDYVEPEIIKFGFFRISDGPLAGKAVRCYCSQETENMKPSVYHPETNECYTAFTQGPCQDGDWFVPSACDGNYICVQNICLGSNKDVRKVAQYKGDCVEIMKSCPGEKGTYQINDETGLVDCVPTSFTPTKLKPEKKRRPPRARKIEKPPTTSTSGRSNQKRRQ